MSAAIQSNSPSSQAAARALIAAQKRKAAKRQAARLKLADRRAAIAAKMYRDDPDRILKGVVLIVRARGDSFDSTNRSLLKGELDAWRIGKFWYSTPRRLREGIAARGRQEAA